MYSEKGWVNSLTEMYIRRADIINRGFSGYNTEHALRVFPKIFSKEQCKNTILFTLFFGANDSGTNVEQAVPLETYQANMQKLISMAVEVLPETCPVVVITPPPCHEAMCLVRRQNINLGPNHYPTLTQTYRNACLDVITAYQQNGAPAAGRVYALDLWEAILGSSWDASSAAFADTVKAYLCDGLHLNARGNDLLFNQLKALIQEKRPDLLPERLASIGPFWAEVDLNNLDGSF